MTLNTVPRPSMEWFYANADEQVGPFSESQMAGLVRTGAVSREALVWREGMASWVPAREAFPSQSIPPPIPKQGGGESPSAGLSSGGGGGAVEARSDLPDGAPGGTRSGTYWDGLDGYRRAVLLLSGFGFVTSMLLAPAWYGYFIALGALAALIGATQFKARPEFSRMMTIRGSLAAGLLCIGANVVDDLQRDLFYGYSYIEISGNDRFTFVLFFSVFYTLIFALSVLIDRRPHRAPQDFWSRLDRPGKAVVALSGVGLLVSFTGMDGGAGYWIALGALVAFLASTQLQKGFDFAKFTVMAASFVIACLSARAFYKIIEYGYYIGLSRDGFWDSEYVNLYISIILVVYTSIFLMATFLKPPPNGARSHGSPQPSLL